MMSPASPSRSSGDFSDWSLLDDHQLEPGTSQREHDLPTSSSAPVQDSFFDPLFNTPPAEGKPIQVFSPSSSTMTWDKPQLERTSSILDVKPKATNSSLDIESAPSTSTEIQASACKEGSGGPKEPAESSQSALLVAVKSLNMGLPISHKEDSSESQILDPLEVSPGLRAQEGREILGPKSEADVSAEAPNTATILRPGSVKGEDEWGKDDDSLEIQDAILSTNDSFLHIRELWRQSRRFDCQRLAPGPFQSSMGARDNQPCETALPTTDGLFRAAGAASKTQEAAKTDLGLSEQKETASLRRRRARTSETGFQPPLQRNDLAKNISRHPVLAASISCASPLAERDETVMEAQNLFHQQSELSGEGIANRSVPSGSAEASSLEKFSNEGRDSATCDETQCSATVTEELPKEHAKRVRKVQTSAREKQELAPKKPQDRNGKLIDLGIFMDLLVLSLCGSLMLMLVVSYIVVRMLGPDMPSKDAVPGMMHEQHEPDLILKLWMEPGVHVEMLPGLAIASYKAVEDSDWHSEYKLAAKEGRDFLYQKYKGLEDVKIHIEAERGRDQIQLAGESKMSRASVSLPQDETQKLQGVIQMEEKVEPWRLRENFQTYWRGDIGKGMHEYVIGAITSVHNNLLELGSMKYLSDSDNTTEGSEFLSGTRLLRKALIALTWV